MKVIYEKRASDFNYRNDKGGRLTLAYPAHIHKHIEMVYMKKGQVRVFINAEEHILSSGELLVVFPNQIHRYEDIERGAIYDLFIVSPDLIPDLSARLLTEEPQDPIIKGVDGCSRIVSLISALSEEKNFPQQSKDLLLKGYLLALMTELFEHFTLKSVNVEESRAIRLIVKFCSKNYKDDISLSSLENGLHLSKYYISHLFSEKLGISFSDYVNHLRVSESCRLLRTTDMSVTEISYAIGYGTPRTFNRAFIKQIGCSPSEYRKKGRVDSLGVSIPRERTIVGEENK